MDRIFKMYRDWCN